jgi:hypothetical protein
MARPEKEGLDYFPLDCDMEEKVYFIEAKHGLIAFAIIIRLYQKIYREGYFSLFDDRSQILFTKNNNVTHELLKQVLDDCLQENVFDPILFGKYNILTSRGIQKRYFKASERRQNVKIMEEYRLIDVNDYKNITIVDKNGINTNISTQSKVKESKVKEKKLLFEKFWQLYPLRNGKKLLKADAEEFFVKEIKDEEFDLLLKAVGNYAVSRTVTDGYVKDAIRFLRKDYWKSWIEAEIPSHKKETPLKCAYDNNRPCYKDCKDCDIAKKKTA